MTSNQTFAPFDISVGQFFRWVNNRCKAHTPVRPMRLRQAIQLLVFLFAVCVYCPCMHTQSRESDRACVDKQFEHSQNTTDCHAVLQLDSSGFEETQLFMGLIALHTFSGFNQTTLTELLQGNCAIERYIRSEKITVFRCLSHTRRPPNSLLSHAKSYSITQRWEKHWNTVSYVICTQEQCCHWPNPPDRARVVTEDRNQFTISPHRRVVLAGDYMDNIWHAMNVLNVWCEMQPDDVTFAGLASGDDFAPYVYTWLKHTGISADRITVVSNDTLLLAREITFTPYRIDWSCLHRVLGRPANCLSSIVVIYRSTRPGRDIPPALHIALVQRIEQQFPHYDVITFYGNETFEEARNIFGNAAAVVGPHGAAFVNVIFCNPRALVLEFMTPEIFRPWQLLGGFSVGLTWLPVLLQTYSDEVQVLNSVELLRAAIDVLHKGKRFIGCENETL